MHIDLNEDDTQLLRQLLESVVSDLSPEIADTDNPDYRRTLIDRRNHIRSILDKLA